MENLDNKTVVIAGVTGGLGGALAAQAVAAGARVYGVGRRQNCDVTGLQAYIQVNLTADNIWQSVVAELPNEIDIAIAATGFLHNNNTMPEKKINDLSAASLQQNYAVNAMLPMQFAQAVLPLFGRDKESVFAALSARVGSISDNQLGGWCSYRMSKAALNMGLKTLSIEAVRTHKKLTVLGLHPGTVATDLSAPFSSKIAAEKLFTPAQSAAYLWEVILTRTSADSGKIFDWQNQEILP